MKDETHGGFMLDEIRLICQLQSEHIVRYHGAVFASDQAGEVSAIGPVALLPLRPGLLLPVPKGPYRGYVPAS